MAGNVQLSPTLFRRLAQPLTHLQDENGVTALMIAAELGSFENCRALQAEFGLRDSLGRNALMYAIVRHRTALVIEMLRWKGADVCDSSGKSVQDYIRQEGLSEKLLKMRACVPYQESIASSGRSRAFVEPGRKRWATISLK